MSIPTLPDSIHIFTYDIRGVDIATGLVKACRQTGLVEQTHQLLSGLLTLKPDLRVAVTQTGAQEAGPRNIRIPEGATVYWQGIRSGFAQYLRDPRTNGKDKRLVDRYYEECIGDLNNPIYESLARQYASAVRRADIVNLLLQNANPMTSLLKAEELGYLDDLTLGQLNVVGVIHDIDTYEKRLGYIIGRVKETKMNVRLIAISEHVYQELLTRGASPEWVHKVPNGLNVDAFMSKLTFVKEKGVFSSIQRRNLLPKNGRMILVPGRRVEHKGHLDVIKAIGLLKRQGELGNLYAAFSGSNMFDTRGLDFEKVLRRAVVEEQVEEAVFFLDPLTNDEMAACYDKAWVSVLASTLAEGFAYANIQAMLAKTPVITTKLGGPLDYIIHDQTGMFVNVRDFEGIANSLKHLQDKEYYLRLCDEGYKKAAGYTIENMAQGYARVICSGRSRLPLLISLRQPFEKIGEGMHTEVFRYPHQKGSVVQRFKPGHTLADLEGVELEYRFLCEAYADMPKLIPAQTAWAEHEDAPLEEVLIVKDEVIPDPSRGNLRQMSEADMYPEARNQLDQFIAITKQLFTHVSQHPELETLGSRVPDIIDPKLDNLIIDIEGNLRLVDTNKLISTEHLKKLIDAGEKLDIEQKKIHSLLLRRLMYLEAKFFGRTQDELRADDFYGKFLAEESLDELFEHSRLAGEPIPS